MVLSTSTNGTSAITAPHSSGSLLTTAPINSPPAERPAIAILPDGEAGVTPMQASLLQADERVGKPENIGADFNTLHGSSTHLSDANDPNGLPARIPELVGAVPEPAVGFTFDGEPMSALPGQTVGAALLAAGIRSWRTTRNESRPRGLFGGSGVCFDCLVTVNGDPGIRACLVQVEDGDDVRTQRGGGRD